MATDPTMHIAFASVEQLGHFMPLVPFIREALDRGHRVTLFLANTPKYAAKIQEFGLQSAELVPVALFSGGKAKMREIGLSTVLSKGGPLAVESEGLFEAITGRYNATDSRHTLPSVIVVDFFSTAAKDAGDALAVPVVNIYPNPIGVFVGLVHPSLRGPGQHLKALIARFWEAVLARILLALRNRERSFRNLPPMIEQDIWPCDTMKRPTISTWDLGYEYPFLQSPLLSFVGLSEPRSFPKVSGDLSTWLENQTCPIVYVAFGTMHIFTSTSSNILFDELSQLKDVAVLWSLPADQQALIAGSAPNIRFETFVPQYAVLSHPKVSMFVSHCGGNSVAESILAEKPLVCCPMGADQPANAARIESAGIGVLAPRGIAGVGHAVINILNGAAAYDKNIRNVKKMLLKSGGAKRGVDIIETVGACGYDHTVPSGQRVSLLKLSMCLISLASFSVIWKRSRA